MIGLLTCADANSGKKSSPATQIFTSFIITRARELRQAVFGDNIPLAQTPREWARNWMFAASAKWIDTARHDARSHAAFRDRRSGNREISLPKRRAVS
jgi:hypothetical protein